MVRGNLLTLQPMILGPTRYRKEKLKPKLPPSVKAPRKVYSKAFLLSIRDKDKPKDKPKEDTSAKNLPPSSPRKVDSKQLLLSCKDTLKPSQEPSKPRKVYRKELLLSLQKKTTQKEAPSTGALPPTDRRKVYSKEFLLSCKENPRLSEEPSNPLPPKTNGPRKVYSKDFLLSCKEKLFPPPKPRKVYSKDFLRSGLAAGTQGDLLLQLDQARRKTLPLHPPNGKPVSTSGKANNRYHTKMVAWKAFRDPAVQNKFDSFQAWLKVILETHSALDVPTLCGLYEAVFGEVLDPSGMGLVQFSLLQMLLAIPGVKIFCKLKDYPSDLVVCWYDDSEGGEQLPETHPFIQLQKTSPSLYCYRD
ncbi:expressed unknown protein [Seminavis robusta]|uniref:Uncharacterized protein n=1 Tax=Seminavis robusta TaxID=568900 RepID=A0A9N8DLA9_9STRA|nr:expressed unknown protein [Seminavis robusta]|eukprot:Sro142_g066170.1 n/a (360) ;mRNA; r:35029-36108